MRSPEGLTSWQGHAPRMAGLHIHPDNLGSPWGAGCPSAVVGLIESPAGKLSFRLVSTETVSSDRNQGEKGSPMVNLVCVDS